MRIMKKGVAVLLSLAMIAGLTTGVGTKQKVVKALTDYSLSNPRVEMQTRDVIEFGSYWQDEYEPKTMPENPQEGEVYTDSDGTEMVYVKYTQSFYKKSPIKWQILSKEDTDGDGNEDDLFLMSDMAIENMVFNDEDHDGRWENSYIRSWLNDTFLSDAFSEEEKAAIKCTQVKNEGNSYYDISGSADTFDYLFLPSIEEAENADLDNM